MDAEAVDSRGLAQDAARARRSALSRRSVLALFGGLGVAGGLAACGQAASGGVPSQPRASASPWSAASSSSPSAPASASVASASAAGPPSVEAVSGPLSEIPDETGGPFPGDGTNGPNVLDDEGIVRRDLRASLAGGAVAVGVPLTTTLVVRDAVSGDAMPGIAVYAWHCDRDGGYSIYSAGLEDEDYLRGVQVADDSGAVTFETIFPGCYPGRWPHIHFSVYRDVAAATGGGQPLKTSQLAFPRESCERAYAADGYASSAANLSELTLARDGVFGEDRGIHQLATMTGDAAGGYTATLLAPV